MRICTLEVKPGTGQRAKFLYATVRCGVTGELLISATLDYVIEAAKQRGYLFQLAKAT